MTVEFYRNESIFTKRNGLSITIDGKKIILKQLQHAKIVLNVGVHNFMIEYRKKIVSYSFEVHSEENISILISLGIYVFASSKDVKLFKFKS